MGRILAAVVVGFVVWSILWVAAAQVVIGVSPESFDEDQSTTDTGLLILFVVLSAVFSIVAGFVAAKIASSTAMKTAWILGIVLFVVGLVIEIAGWDKAPAWYHIVFLVPLIPCVLIGAKPVAGKRSA
jgi:Ca2+/Na+ antiporter